MASTSFTTPAKLRSCLGSTYGETEEIVMCSQTFKLQLLHHNKIVNQQRRMHYQSLARVPFKFNL